MIAAYVMNRGMTLVTGNTKHYRFIIDAGFSLQLENWRKP